MYFDTVYVFLYVFCFFPFFEIGDEIGDIGLFEVPEEGLE